MFLNVMQRRHHNEKSYLTVCKLVFCLEPASGQAILMPFCLL